MTSRRQFLKLSAAGLALTTAPLGCALIPRRPAPGYLLFSAADTGDGQHTLVGLNANALPQIRLTVQDRCHGGCHRPGSQHVLLFARRPGRHFYVLDTRSGQQIATVAAEAGHHFYGHGVFSRDGRYLYTTENHYPSGQGVIGVYDADAGYTRVRQLPAGGIGPHELRLHPNGDTLVVALGGIQTHPDYQRIKMNLDSMAPALLLINRHDGAVEARYEPSHPQLSCRHLDVSPEGVVIAGYQFQGPQWQTPPLIARLDSRSGTFSEIALDDALLPQLHNYTASVATHPLLPVTAMTAPRGGKVVILDHQQGQFLKAFDVPDCAGVVPAGQDGFIVTSGTGSVLRIPPDLRAPIQLQALDLRWDNHLTAMSIT